MGGVAGPPLVAAVCRAGALGTLPMAAVAPFAERIQQVVAAAPGPFAVNVLMPFLSDRGDVETAAEHARVVEFFWAAPDPSLIDLVHDGGALAAWQVGSVDDARAAADAGCDLVIAQGVEAGGHVCGTVPLMALLDGVLSAIDVPVVAAGGIATGRGVAAVLAAGADGARIGARFVATKEADAHPEYLAALVAAGADDTVLTTAFAAGWPDAPHRVLRSSVEAAEAAADGAVVIRIGEASIPLPRFSVSPPTLETEGEVRAAALYAGQGVGSVTSVEGAADVVGALVGETTARLHAAAGLVEEG